MFVAIIILMFTTVTLFFEKKYIETEVMIDLQNVVVEQQEKIGSFLEDPLSYYSLNKIRNTQKTYILDANGTLVWSSLEHEEENVVSSYILPLVMDHQSLPLYYDDYRNRKVMGIYRWVNNSRWVIVNEVDRAEVLRPFYNKIYLYFLASFILIALHYYFQVNLYRRIQSPIQQMIEDVDSLVEGKYNCQMNNVMISDSPSELQQLYYKFNEIPLSMQKTELNRQQMECSFFSLVSSTKDAIILADKQMRVLLWNKGAESIFGFSQKEMEGKSFINIIPDCYKQQHFFKFRNHDVMKKEASTTMELKAIKKNGLEFPIELTIASWKFNNEDYFYGIVRDISNRKVTEGLASTTEEKYRSAFENSGVGIVLATLEGKFIYFNRAFQRLLKYEENELLQLSFRQVTHPGDMNKDKHLFEKLLTKHVEKYQVEKRYINHDQEVTWVCLTISKLQLSSSNEEYIIAMVEDITGKKLAEETLKRSEDYLSNIVEMIPNGVIIIDTDGNISFANTMATKLLHLNRRKLLNRSINVSDIEIRTISGKTFRKGKLFLKALIEKKREIKNLELTVQKLDGSSIQISLNATPLIEDGEVTGILASVMDISDRIKIQQQLKKTNMILAEKSMKDPLTGIANRRQFNKVIEREWSRHCNYKSQLSIIMIDIDHFKEYNDEYGHLQGDNCLKIVANASKSCLKRPGDFIARFGGEEFIVILPETPLKGAVYVGERIRKKIESLKIPHESSSAISNVTVSIGVATSYTNNDFPAANHLIERADKALYKAKLLGRNQVGYYDHDSNFFAM